MKILENRISPKKKLGFKNNHLGFKYSRFGFKKTLIKLSEERDELLDRYIDILFEFDDEISLGSKEWFSLEKKLHSIAKKTVRCSLYEGIFAE